MLMSKTSIKKFHELKDSPFYKMRTKKKLARLLGTNKETMSCMASDRGLYERVWKHKEIKKGHGAWLNEMPSPETSHQYRPIDKPDPRLKKIQSRVADLLSRITPPEWLFSPVKGRSYVDNASRHQFSSAFWLLDVADYFGSCSANNVAHFFGKTMGCSPDVTAIMVGLVTHNECLPQGSPCSPILAYFSNLDMWMEIAGKVEAEGLLHSVYVDDITISGKMVPKKLIWEVKKVVRKHGLRLKPNKEGSVIHSPAFITGVIVADTKTKLPNQQLKRLLELRSERHHTREEDLRKMLDSQIAGREAQKKQVEGA